MIHHDRLKLYRDAEHPVWVKRLRNKILAQSDTHTRDMPKPSSKSDDSDDTGHDLSNLFSRDADASDVLMHSYHPDVSHSVSHQDKPDESDVLTYQQVSDTDGTKDSDSSGWLGRQQRSRGMLRRMAMRWCD